MTARKLRTLGFVPAGEFRAAAETGGRIRYHQRELLPLTGGLYAFVLADQVVYIGVASNLRRRIAGAHGRPLTAARKASHAATQLRRVLHAGDRVRVMIATPEPGEWNGIPVDTALGLEPGLIKRAKPTWNMLGHGGPDALQLWQEAGRKAHATRQQRLWASSQSSKAARATSLAAAS